MNQSPSDKQAEVALFRTGTLTLLSAALLCLPLAVAAPSAPAGRTAPAGVVNVKVSYGTTDSAIRKAISAAQSSGRALYFPAGTYTYTSNLFVNGLTVYGDGATTVLTATNPQASAIVMRGTGGVIRDLEIVSPNATSRSSTGAASGIQVYHAAQFTIQNVVVDGTAETGIIVRGGVNGMIRGNTVQNTLADAIHMTLGSHDITVSGNVVRNPGDDMIAVVSYLSQGTPCRNITISDNDVQGQTWGRGISTVGGENVTISGNSIGQTYGAGVYVAAEGDPYYTFGALNVKVMDNNITGTDLAGIGHGAVQLNGQPGHLVDGTLVSGNVIRQSHYGINVEHDVDGTIIGTNDVALT